MDGDFANLKEITEFAERKNIITVLDDAHGDFTVGQDGKGSANSVISFKLAKSPSMLLLNLQ